MVINLVRENPIQILSNDFQVFYPNFLTFDHDFSITFSFLTIDNISSIKEKYGYEEMQ